MDDVNVYTDLQDVDLGNQIEKLQENNRALLDHIHELEGDIAKLCGEVTSMKDVQKNLTKNISELYNTAKVELERKDRMIADMRNELDDLLFRRTERNENVKRPRCEPNVANKRQKIDKIECNRKSASIERKNFDKMHHRSDRSRNRRGDRHQSNYRNKCDDYNKERRSRDRHRSTRRSRSPEARKHDRNKPSNSREKIVDRFKNNGSAPIEIGVKQEVGAAIDRAKPYDDSCFRVGDRSNSDVKPFQIDKLKTEEVNYDTNTNLSVNVKVERDIKTEKRETWRYEPRIELSGTMFSQRRKYEMTGLDDSSPQLERVGDVLNIDMKKEVEHDMKTDKRETCRNEPRIEFGGTTFSQRRKYEMTGLNDSSPQLERDVLNIDMKKEVEHDIKTEKTETWRNEPRIELSTTTFSQRRRHEMTRPNGSNPQLERMGGVLNIDVKNLPCEDANGPKGDNTTFEIKDERNCDLKGPGLVHVNNGVSLSDSNVNGLEQVSVSSDGGNLTGDGIETVCSTSVPRRPARRRRCVIQIKD